MLAGQQVCGGRFLHQQRNQNMQEGRFHHSFCRALPVGLISGGWNVRSQPYLFVLLHIIKEPGNQNESFR